MRNVMIDLETMGTDPDAAIVSIGACKFDIETKKIGDTYYLDLDWRAQDRHICPSTEQWWAEQGEAAKKCLCRGKIGLQDALDSLRMFLPEDCIVWGNGATFDISILENAYGRGNAPWKFWNVRDVRTVVHVYAICKNTELGRGMFKGTPHNALDDAIFQAEYVARAIREIKYGRSR